MRIAYLSHSLLPSAAANGVQVMRMCAAFVRNGHDLTLYARGSAAEQSEIFEYYGVNERFAIEFVPGGSGRLGALAYARSVASRLREARPPDLVYGRHVYSLVAADRLGIPMVYEAHVVHPRPDVWRGRNLLVGLAERRLVRRPSLVRVVCISYALRQDLLDRHCGRVRAEVMVAHDAADVVDPGAGSGLRKANRLQVGYVGHLYAGRGLELVQALAARLPGMDFHVVGGMPEATAELRRAVEVLDNFHVHGHVRPAEVSDVLRRFDVVLAPYQTRVAVAGGTGDTSRWMSPLKLFEYMAHAKPIVASDLPSLREFLDDGVNALLVEPDYVAGWEEALQRLDRDASLCRRLGERAYVDLLDKHTWTARAQRVLSGLGLPG